MSTQKEATIWQRLGDIIRRERVASGLSLCQRGEAERRSGAHPDAL